MVGGKPLESDKIAVFRVSPITDSTPAPTEIIRLSALHLLHCFIFASSSFWKSGRGGPVHSGIEIWDRGVTTGRRWSKVLHVDGSIMAMA